MLRCGVAFISVLVLTSTAFGQATPERFLVGVHGPGRMETMPVLDVDGLRVVRLLTNHKDIGKILECDDPNDPNGARYKFDRLLDGYDSECVEVILTVRIPDPDDNHFDYIPPVHDPNNPDQIDQQDIRDAVRTFIAEYACRISACQLGNEIFGGPGTYRVEGREPSEWIAGDMEAVFDWLASLADEIDAGAALAGCEVSIISPALTPGLVRTGARGAWDPDGTGCGYGEEPFCDVPDCNSPCLTENTPAATAIEGTVTFANEHCDAMDVHLHSECVDYLNDVINLIVNDPCDKLSVELAPGVALTCMEWSAAKGAAQWLKQPTLQDPSLINADLMFEFLKRRLWCLGECDLCDVYGPPGSDEWDFFVGEFNDWFLAETGDDLTGFASAALASMEANGFMHACYGGGSQRGVTSETEIQVRDDCEDPNLFPDHVGDIYVWDVTQLRADKTTDDPNNPDAWSFWIRQAFEEAAAPYMPIDGDGDDDGDIDWGDFISYSQHMAGPDRESCDVFDFDDDNDADLIDFAAFQTAFGV